MIHTTPPAPHHDGPILKHQRPHTQQRMRRDCLPRPRRRPGQTRRTLRRYRGELISINCFLASPRVMGFSIEVLWLAAKEHVAGGIKQPIRCSSSRTSEHYPHFFEFRAMSHSSHLSEHAQCGRHYLRMKRRMAFHFAIEVQQLKVVGPKPQALARVFIHVMNAP